MPPTAGSDRAFHDHKACENLTALTIEHLPRDGTLGRPIDFEKGEDIWRPEDRADCIYFIQTGQVAIVATDPEGRETVLRTINRGEIFGELCFCSRQRRDFARAISDGSALAITYDTFLGYLREHHNALNRLVFTFCERLTQADRRVEVLAHRGAEQRLGTLLLQMAELRGYARDEQKDTVMLRTSHEELSRMAAMSRSHVTVVMGRFRTQGLIDYARDRPMHIHTSDLKSYLETHKRPGDD